MIVVFNQTHLIVRMKEYQFQYTKTSGTLLVLMICFAVFIITILIGVSLKIQEILIMGIELVLMILLFQFLKKIATGNCIAKINDTKVEFNLEEDLKIINFSDLVSFKVHYGSNATVLYLKTENDNFKIYTTSFSRENFQSFCKDIQIRIEEYKASNKTQIIHKGSIFATAGMLYFLVIATLIYLLAFIVETKELRLAIGISGGFYLLIMWIAYSNKRKLEDK